MNWRRDRKRGRILRPHLKSNYWLNNTKFKLRVKFVKFLISCLSLFYAIASTLSPSILNIFFVPLRFMMKNVMKLQNSFTDVDGYKKFDITLIFRTTFLNYAVLILLEGHRFERYSRKRSISGRQWTVNNCRSIGEDDDDVLWFGVQWSFTPAFFPLPLFRFGLVLC